MPWKIQTPDEIAAKLRARFDAGLKGVQARLWPNNVAVSAKAVGTGLAEVYDHQAWIKEQIFVRSCAEEVLEDHGADLGLPIRQAAAASGEVTATASSAVVVLAGTIVTRGDGRSYRVVTDAGVAAAGPISVSVVALEAGAGGVALPGVEMSFTGVAQLSAAVVGSNGLTGGADKEAFDAYRERLWFFKKYRPGHARPSDYVIWAGEVAGVSRVYVERRPYGPGTVRVYVLFDGIYENGIPPAGEIARVKSYLDIVGASGVADIIVEAPEPEPIDITVTGLSQNLIATRNTITEEIAETFLRRAVVAGTDAGHKAMPFLATAQTFSRSWIGQAVSNAAGEDRHVLALPTVDVTVPPGSIPVPGTVAIS